MKDKLSPAVEALLDHLKEQLASVSETKKMINSLRAKMGEDALFTDVESESIDATGSARADAYYGKPLATAVTEAMRRRGSACTADEILSALERGGFDFKILGWSEKDRLRLLALSIAKNTKAFHRLPNGTYGLLSWYPEVEKRQRARSTTNEADNSAPEEEGQKGAA